MKLFVTVLERTAEEAVRAIAAITADHDGIEVRAESFPEHAFAAIRAATTKPILYTLRGRGPGPALALLPRAIEAGIDLVDVEWDARLCEEDIAPHASRVVLSHHDYASAQHPEELLHALLRFGAAHAKLAVTPSSFHEDLALLGLLRQKGDATLTVIGMGERGLYSRIVAPFSGSEFVFASAGQPTAPGQLSHARALEIYGPEREALRADRFFAVVGNPAGHSLSPVIHNRLFREKGVAAAYGIVSADRLTDVTSSFVHGEPCGLSVTAPFKEDAFHFARKHAAAIGGNAVACGAVNTLVNVRGKVIADNTDVDGFRMLLRRVCGLDRKSVAIIGAGGTARAARAALEVEQMPYAVFNRTPGRLGAASLDALMRWDGEIVIDTTPADIDLPLRPGMTLIRASYGAHSSAAERAAAVGVELIDGLQLLEAQAARQHELFMKAVHTCAREGGDCDAGCRVSARRVRRRTTRP